MFSLRSTCLVFGARVYRRAHMGSDIVSKWLLRVGKRVGKRVDKRRFNKIIHYFVYVGISDVREGQ